MSHSEACHFLHVVSHFFPKGETLMLKANLLTSVAYFLAGLFGKSEGMNWN